jgi:hypothetical protein
LTDTNKARMTMNSTGTSALRCAKDAVLQWLNTRERMERMAVTLTFKRSVLRHEPTTGRQFWERLDGIKASRNVRHFLNRLNKAVYGAAFNRYGKQLRSLVVMEGGKEKRPHVHLEIERPAHVSVEEFERLILKCWGETAFGYDESKITRYSDDGWRDYILKVASKEDNDLGRRSGCSESSFRFDVYSSAIDWLNVCLDRSVVE